ncbi:hypothetical protein ACFLZV_03475 [Candidatus Margulisiibacteriota bacterium]
MLELKTNKGFWSLINYRGNNFLQWFKKMTNESAEIEKKIEKLVGKDQLLKTMLQFDPNKRTWKEIKKTQKQIEDDKILKELLEEAEIS